jgi:hypothetical protein
MSLIGALGMASWFKEALQDPKRLLLLLGGAIFDDAMKFLDQDASVGFLSFEVEEYRRRNTQSGGNGAYDFQGRPFFASLYFPQIVRGNAGSLGGELPGNMCGITDRTDLPSK